MNETQTEELKVPGELPVSDEPVEFADEYALRDEDLGDPWKVLIVDDDEDVHKMTGYVLKNFVMEGRPLQLINARTGKEAREIMVTVDDIALILLDVVMESDDAGLRFVKYVRERLDDQCVQIVLRTGQPGLTCELDAIMQYEINDYKTKTELSAEKLFTTVASSLRAYKLASSYRDTTQRLEEELQRRIKAEVELEESKRGVEEKVWTRTQELLEAKEKAEYSLRNRSEFLANVVHEIRTPLNGVLSGTRLLEECDLQEEPRLYVDTLSQSTKYLLAMVGDIMDFSKIEEGKMTLTEERFDLRGVVEHIGQLLSPMALEKGLALHVDYAMDAPRFIRGDANRLRQIITNLVGNGIKYTNEGHVLLKVSVEEDEMQRMLAIHVTDTGIGISPEQRESIFERFTQTAAGEKKMDSSGLGLFITKHLVDMMGGTINVLSVPGSGSSFAVRLPVEFGTQEISRQNLLPDQNKRALLAIGDAVARGILRKRLIMWGFDVIESVEAVPSLEALTFAIVDPENLAALKIDPGQSLLDELDGVILLKRADQLLNTEFSSHPKVKQLSLPLQTHQIANVVSEVIGSSAVPKEPDTSAIEEAIWPQFGLKVLIADDESVNRTVIRIMLEKLGCAVTCAEDGEAAVEAFRNDNFDIIFLDHRMPSISGAEAAVEMKKERLDNCPPIYAMTGDDQPSQRKLFFASGMKGVISKPIDWEQLMEALERAKA